jgi:creatinine amidohydrolase
MPVLKLMTWPQVADYLTLSRGIMIPAGSIEQHAAAGLLGTDAICAETVAMEAARLSGAMVGPTIEIGMAQFNLGFPGTLSLRPSTLVSLMVDYVKSLAVTGFTHVYVLNGHGGNVAPIRTAFQEVYAERSFGGAATPLPWCRLVNWWDPPSVNALRRDLYAGSEGFHATPSEVSLTAAVHPDKVHPAGFPPGLPPPERDTLIQHGGDPYFDAADHRARYPDGRVLSDPSLASEKAGQDILRVAGAAIAEDYRRFVASQPSNATA